MNIIHISLQLTVDFLFLWAVFRCLFCSEAILFPTVFNISCGHSPQITSDKLKQKITLILLLLPAIHLYTVLVSAIIIWETCLLISAWNKAIVTKQLIKQFLLKGLSFRFDLLGIGMRRRSSVGILRQTSDPSCSTFRRSYNFSAQPWAREMGAGIA